MNRGPEIERYLANVRAQLGSATASEEEEVIRVLSARIEALAETTGANAESVLEELGPVEKVAHQYRNAGLIARASRSNSPLLLLHASLKNGPPGLLAFLIGLAGYWFGGCVLVFGALSLLWSVLYYKPNARAAIGSSMLQTFLTVVAGCVVLLLTTFLLRAQLRASKRARPS